MNPAFPNLQNANIAQLNKYIYCPSGKCLLMPEIEYSNTPLKTKLLISCKCQEKDGMKINMNLNEFLDRSSHLICFICKKKIFDEQILFCLACRNTFDSHCIQNHSKNSGHLNYFQLNTNNIFNTCLMHHNPYMFRCTNCAQSFCKDCNFSEHDENGHDLNQIKKLLLNQSEIDKKKALFEKQKKLFEKIKDINNNFISSLENDILLKERIINSFEKCKNDYNSILNFNNLNITNNEKYETILENLLSNKKETNENDITNNDFVNNYLSILYYSLMINNDSNLNDSLIKDFENKVIKINSDNNAENKYIKNKELSIGKEINFSIKSNNRNYNLLINSNRFYNNTSPLGEFRYYSNINSLSETNTINKGNQYFPGINAINDNKKFNYIQTNPNLIPDENIQKIPNNYDYFIQNDININSSINKSFSSKKKHSNFDKNDKNTSSLSNSQNHSDKNIQSKSVRYNKPSSLKKKPEKERPKTQKIEDSSSMNIESDVNSEGMSQKSNKNKRNNSNEINNMIVLQSGNIAVSRKEAIEIYDLRKIDFSGVDCYYDNDLIQKMCLLQRINLVKGRKINYVFQFCDGTLFCATYQKIFRVKLLNNDSNYEIISFIKIAVSELPTKIISLGDSILAILSEQKKNCNIKIYQKIENVDEENKENNLKKNENKNNKEKDALEDNFNDVPAIGNSGLFFNCNKELNEDPSFLLIIKNVNKSLKLWTSIHPIKKDKSDKIYLYEFIAISNKTYDLGGNKIAFFGIYKNIKEDYCSKLIKEIDNISCSVEADSICQINDKYLIVGLQNHNLIGQISGFAFIDINNREISRIIQDNEISCVFYNANKNLLFASMEVRNKKQNYFMTKIYKIISNKGDRGNEEIDLQNIYEYKNKHTDTITSIQEMNNSYFKLNLERQDIANNLIFVTSSKDSTLEVIKAEIENK